MLKQALLANAGFSAISGTIMLLQTAWLHSHIPLPAVYWTILGLGLISFAISLLVIAGKHRWRMQLATTVVIGDVLWVVAASGLTLVFFSQITILGVALISLVNLFVGTFAVLQYIGWQRSASKEENSIDRVSP